MEKTFVRLLPPLLVCWLLGAIDGVCVALGAPFLGRAGGNLVTGLFFVFFLLALIAGRGNRRRMRGGAWWAGAALLGMVAMLFVLWGVVALGGPKGLRSACMVVMALVSAPTASCSVMLIPVFLWSVILVGSIARLRRMKE